MNRGVDNGGNGNREPDNGGPRIGEILAGGGHGLERDPQQVLARQEPS